MERQTDRQTETKKEAEVVTLSESTPSQKPSEAKNH